MSTGAILLTEASSGAPRNAGTNGDLTTLLDWALPQAGWAIEYTSGNARVYRPPSGNRFRLHVNHDSAVSGDARLAVVRGCENASDATTLVDPFPTVAQIANTASNWCISNTANTTTRAFKILVSPTFVIYLSNFNGIANNWDLGWFGDVWPTVAADTFNTAILQRNSSAATATAGINAVTSVSADTLASSVVFFARDITGTVKSSRGKLYASGSPLGQVSGAPSALSGYLSEVSREPVGLSCIASSTTTAGTNTIIRRAFIPNIWSGLHGSIGALTENDTFTDTAYNASSLFRGLKGSGTPWIILEESDTSINPGL